MVWLAYFKKIPNILILWRIYKKNSRHLKTLLKTLNESNNNITENNKTPTESINNLLLHIITTNRTLLDNSTQERNILNDKNDAIDREVERRKRLHQPSKKSKWIYTQLQKRMKTLTIHQCCKRWDKYIKTSKALVIWIKWLW